MDAAELAGRRNGEREQSSATDPELLDPRLERWFYRLPNISLDVRRNLVTCLDIDIRNRPATLVDFDPDHDGSALGVRHSDEVFHDNLRIVCVWHVDEVLIFRLTSDNDFSDIHAIDHSVNK